MVFNKAQAPFNQQAFYVFVAQLDTLEGGLPDAILA